MLKFFASTILGARIINKHGSYMMGIQSSTKTLRNAIVLALGLGVAQIASAVSLGPIHVSSYMGQPLKATIALSDVGADEVTKMSVRLASAAEYQARGIKRTAEQSSLSFRVIRAGGGYAIAVSSSAPILEPFINFILTVNTGGKVVNHEYAAFLNPDPMAQADQALAEAVTPANAKSQSKNARNSRSDDEFVRSPTPSTKGGSTYGPVRKGETLFAIANKVRPSNVSPEDMMQAIFRANPSAFSSSSITSLKSGVHLTIPSFGGSDGASESRRQAQRNEQTQRSEQAQQQQTAQQKTAKTYTADALPPKEPETVFNYGAPSQEVPVVNNQEAGNAQQQATQQTTQQTTAATEQSAQAQQVAQAPQASANQPIDSSLQLDSPDSVEVPATGGEFFAPAGDDFNAVAQQATAAEQTAQAQQQQQAQQPKPESKPKPQAQQAQVAKPKPQQTNRPKPAPAPAPTPVVEEGIPLWQMAAAGAGGLLVILGALFALKRLRARRKDNDLDVERMVAEMEADGISIDMGEPMAPRSRHHALRDEAPEPVKGASAHGHMSDDELKALDELSRLDDLAELSEGAQDMAQSAQVAANQLSQSVAPTMSAPAQSDDDFFGMGTGMGMGVSHEPSLSSATPATPATKADEDDFFAPSATTAPAQEEVAQNTGFGAGMSLADDFFSDKESAPQTLSAETASAPLTPEVAPAPAPQKADTINFSDDFFASSAPAVEEKPQSTIASAGDLSMDDFFAKPEKSEPIPVKPVVRNEPALSMDTPLAAPEVNTAISQADVQAAEISLNLAEGYMKKGVNKPEKVRIWLNEVVVKGSEEQKARARELLAQFDE